MAALIVALALVVVFGMTVLVVDLGALIVKHRGLVNANDAAAVAAAGSFAVNDDEVAAQSEADRLAKKNVDDAERDTLTGWNVVAGLPGFPCDLASCGSVSVRYQSPQALFFGPAIGLGENVTAHGAATAIWGPAGGGRPAPIAIHTHWLNECGVPNSDSVVECAFWLDGRSGDDDDEGSDSEWAWINLNEWNVTENAQCPDVQPGDLSEWIAGRDVPQVRVNLAPSPTLVCTSSGRPGRQSTLSVLQAQEGKFKVFPVNDAAGEFAPPGEVGDKYNIVGFTVLRIERAIQGDEDGLPGGTADCSWENVHLEQGFPVYLRDQLCPWEDLHYPGDANKPFPAIRKGNKDYKGETVENCQKPEYDYCYEQVSSEITWRRQNPVNDATIEWQYEFEPTPGECGIHELDPDAVCLVVSWQGYRTGGINPGGGVDFGLRAIRLSA